MSTNTAATPSVRQPRTRRGVLLAAGAAAVLLGVLAELAGYLPGSWQYLSQATYPWLLGAFTCGAAARTPSRGGAAGSAFLLTGLVANTAFKWVLHGRDAARPMLEHEWQAWLVTALALGLVYGLTGWVRTHRQGTGAAVATAVLLATGLAEAAADATRLLPWTGSGAAAVVVLVGVSAVVVLRGFTRRQLAVVATTVAALTPAALALAPVLTALVPAG